MRAAQLLGNAGVAGFNLLDFCQQLVQVRRDYGFTHGVDEVLRPARQGIGSEFGRFLLGRWPEPPGRDYLAPRGRD